MPPDSKPPTKLIKKYANRRLYDTDKSRYITLADLTILAREQVRFVVEDARTGDDITRQILVQIISDHEVEEETSMMSVDALREVVSLYVPSPINQMFINYLGNALTNFMRQQSGIQRHMDGLFAEFAPPSTHPSKDGEDTQTNMWNSLTQIFDPNTSVGDDEQPEPSAAPTLPAEQTARTPLNKTELQELQEQMANLQQKLDLLSGD
jgi:polyhydroxyalkanoate synthesis repressor PhaR